jgi:electron-transferring-flavoprotein dehydrogenase
MLPHSLKGNEAEREARREHVRQNMQYAGLLGRACPAGVYEYVEANDGSSAHPEKVEDEGANGKKLVINSQV